jgi:hypothetical protein
VLHARNVLHELWVDDEGLDSLCLAGPEGDGARALLQQPARLVWTVEATSHFEAMTAYYRYRGRGTYTTDFPEEDHRLYLGDDL